ncbi:PfkB family carbohydrate kinase [Paracoccus kondratievae]
MTEVVVKNAGGPILAASGAVLLRHDPASVAPLDTTGAGDSFNGGYLAARLQGQSIDRALCCGANLAARVIRHPGALIPMEQLTASGT